MTFVSGQRGQGIKEMISVISYDFGDGKSVECRTTPMRHSVLIQEHHIGASGVRRAVYMNMDDFIKKYGRRG